MIYSLMKRKFMQTLLRQMGIIHRALPTHGWEGMKLEWNEGWWGTSEETSDTVMMLMCSV